MSNSLIEIEALGLDAMNSGDYQRAISYFEQLVAMNPSWEHGGGFYNLAGCYEDIGNTELADRNYSRALEIAPSNWYFIGGYADFLARYGEPETAFEWNLKFLKANKDFRGIGGAENANADAIERTEKVLMDIGARMGLPPNAVREKIANLI